MAAPLRSDLKLVLFDGVCNLCDGFVKFLLARDTGKVLTFASLQSAAAAPYLAAHGITTEEALKSVVFIDGDTAYRKAGAALAIFSHLPQPWAAVGAAGACVPRRLADAAYDFVASHRYTWFGKHEEGSCMARTPAVMARFLDAAEMKATAAAARAAARAAAAASGEAKKDA